ncbi:MAG: hypothetical protein LBU25_10300 [Treponema sp.]|jgi:hypothetical protein|nr:hypothetical protein [Treponema sp.]
MDTFLINAFEPQEGRWYCWNVNGAVGYLKKEGTRWQTAVQVLPFKDMTDDFYGPREEVPPEGLPRSVMVGPGTALTLRPVLSEKPYLVPVQERLCLVPATEAHFTVLFPPALAFETEDNQRIAAFTPFTCSEAWFGDDTASGALCVSLPPRCLTRHPEEASSAPPSLIRCPLVIRNRSKTPLELDRLAIYTEPLSIYEHKGSLWSDTVALDATVGGNIEMNVLPEIPEAYRKIREAPRNDTGDFLIRQGADFIKNITSL